MLLQILMHEKSLPIFLTNKKLSAVSLREKCPKTEFFWSVFSRIWIEYRDLLRKMRCGKGRTRKTPYLDNFYTVYLLSFSKNKQTRTTKTKKKTSQKIRNF